MKLTSEDIKMIDEISCDVGYDFAVEGFKKPWGGEEFYEEVARRFNERKRTTLTSYYEQAEKGTSAGETI